MVAWEEATWGEATAWVVVIWEEAVAWEEEETMLPLLCPQNPTQKPVMEQEEEEEEVAAMVEDTEMGRLNFQA